MSVLFAVWATVSGGTVFVLRCAYAQTHFIRDTLKQVPCAAFLKIFKEKDSHRRLD